jgi:predicted NodU family carbamoyl transferase
MLNGRDGSRTEYYLSAYLSVPGPGSVLDPTRHDHSVALWSVEDGRIELATYWELERLSGQKHHDWPLFTDEAVTRFLDFLLCSKGLSLDDITGVWGTPGLATNDAIERVFGTLPFPVHSLAHLYSSLLSDVDLFRSETIVAMALDGGPDIALDATTKQGYYAGAVSRAGVVELVAIESPGPLFRAAELILGQEPGTLMALAEVSDARIAADPQDLADSGPYLAGADMYRKARGAVAALADQARESVSSTLPQLKGTLSAEDHVASAVMKVVQRASELIAERNIDHLLATFDVDPTQSYLGLAGGFALNCPTNSLLMSKYGFRGLLAAPCVNDSGQALGLGILGFAAEEMLPKYSFSLRTAYRGPAELGIDKAIEKYGPWIEDISKLDHATLCEDLIDGPLAWVAGRSEIGPRALGHRSLLADPRTLASKDALNALKGRQWWRPVAPVVLLEEVGAWFDNGRPSPYMLEAFSVRLDCRSLVPAVVHLDGSARVQTLARSDDEVLYEALRAFDQKTGVPMLCNTSLNDKGEPIAATASQALGFCVRKGMRVAYIDGVRIQLRREIPGALSEPLKREGWLFADQEQTRDKIWADWQDRGIGPEELYAMTRVPELRSLVRGHDGPRAVRAATAAIAAGALRGDFARLVARYVHNWGPGSSFSYRWERSSDAADVCVPSTTHDVPGTFEITDERGPATYT